MDMEKSQQVKKAVLIGGMCSLSYLAVYFGRNILGAVTPQMIDLGYDAGYIGQASSVYFVSYAVGQLINGAIGDKIKSHYMISFGLLMAGVASFLFPRLIDPAPTAALAIYGLTGFFLSMIYGPMTKVVAENTIPIYATRCSLGYTFASFFGSPIAGVAAAFMTWGATFSLSATTLVLMATVCFLVFLYFEKKGIVRYKQYDRPRGQKGGVHALIERQIVRFSLISMITGVVRTAVVFWMPTYFKQYLGFSAEQSSLIFTVSTLAISLTAFIAIFLYERLGRDMNRAIRLFFILAAVLFLLLCVVKQPIVNIVVMTLAVMSSNSAASVLWSCYCPSLRDTGMVSSATGFLDFISYMAASISSSLFANASEALGWHALILVWFGLMIAGLLTMAPFERLFKRNRNHAATQ